MLPSSAKNPSRPKAWMRVRALPRICCGMFIAVLFLCVGLSRTPLVVGLVEGQDQVASLGQEGLLLRPLQQVLDDGVRVAAHPGRVPEV